MIGRDTVEIEIRLLLEALYEKYGLDFRDYAQSFVRRRILRHLGLEGLPSVSRLQESILHTPAKVPKLLSALTIGVTSLFRDPAFYAEFRSRVVPLLRTYPFFRIWVVGCATGEEVYSLAVVLEEEGIYDRGRIYATDANESFLERAEAGVFPLESMIKAVIPHAQSGGKGGLADAWVAQGPNGVIHSRLRRNVVFSQHNLVTDGSFNEFNVIWCRNVLIYFQRPLQERVHRLLDGSLVRFGVLGLGDRESLNATSLAGRYEPMHPREKLFRKVA